MITFIYSEKAEKTNGSSKAVTEDGTEYIFTLQINEKEFGSWKDNYFWDDAEEVAKLPEGSFIVNKFIVANLTWIKNI